VWFIFSWENLPFSLNKVFYLFCLLFLGIAPLLQYQHNISFWAWDILEERVYVMLNIVILITLIIYQSIYTVFFLKIANFKKKNDHTKVLTYFFSRSKIFLLILLSLFSFTITLASRGFDLVSLMFRGSEFSVYAVESQTQMLLIDNFVRPLSMMCLLFYLIAERKKSIFVLLILVTLALITCPPSGMPRFAAAALYLPLVLISFPFIRRRNIFPLVFLLSFLFLFPFLNIFRAFNPDSEITGLGFNTEMFLKADFDSYYNFAIIFSENIVTYGRQLLGVVFFWIPRSVWSNKPVGSGSYIADQLGFEFSNISANFFAEGYINFGLIGILLFAIVLAVLTSFMDAKNFFDKSKSIFFTMMYLLFIGLLFFILRGDLLSSFAYTIGYSTSVFIVTQVAKPQKDLVN
jgi:oligosaccharide repeat unit polymerase